MAKFEEVKKILKSKMALEQCDSDVMPYFTDYYWVPEDQITELAKELCQLFEAKNLPLLIPDKPHCVFEVECPVVIQAVKAQRNLSVSI